MTRQAVPAVLVSLVALTGCATTQDVYLAKAVPVTTAVATAAHAPDEGNSPEMDAILAGALRGEGVSVTTTLPPRTRQSPGVDVVVSYVDVWRWDLTMYLQSISIRLFDAKTGDLLVTGEWKDSDLHGFRDPQLVVNGLMAEMLAKLRGGAPAGTTAAALAVARPTSPPHADPGAQTAPASVNEWVSIGSPSELRAIYSDTTIRGRVYGRNTAQGTPYVGQFRSNGTGVVEVNGRRVPRTWEIRGHNMVCTRSAQSTDCYRLQRNRVNPNEYRGRHVSRDLSVQFTVERAGGPAVNPASSTPRSVQSQAPAAVATAAASSTAATRTLQSEGAPSAEPGLSGYSCCNFHYSGDLVSDANWSSLPMLHAGTPMSPVKYSGYRIEVLVDQGGYGRRMLLNLDYGRQQSLGEWARRMIVQEDPKPTIASWPEPVRDAISGGKVAIGMTKEQVIVSLGYPPAHETPSLDADTWKYWYGRLDSYQVKWSASGQVESVIAEPHVRVAVLAAGSVPIETQPPVSSPAQQALADRTRSAAPGGLPAPGTVWTYALTDRAYRNRKEAVTVSVSSINGAFVEETVASSGGVFTRRVINAPQSEFVLYPLGRSTSMIELAPYLLSSNNGKALPVIGNPRGYPVGAGGMPGWITTATVQGWEQVSVPAGTFRALRVKVDGKRERPSFAWGQSSHFSFLAWYAPEVGRAIKVEHKAWMSGQNLILNYEVLELQSYRPPS